MARRSCCYVWPVLLWACLASCGNTKVDLNAASAGVSKFHVELELEDYAGIYDEADPRFREASKKEDFIAFMSAIHRKLGTVTSTTQKGYFVNYNTSGSTIRINYDTKFAEGDAEEQFVWAKNGDKLLLLGYHVNSNVLITK